MAEVYFSNISFINAQAATEALLHQVQKAGLDPLSAVIIAVGTQHANEIITWDDAGAAIFRALSVNPAFQGE
jgi:hypothetical protein